uniref:carbonic anhydrase n=1 Tax=Pyropia haitanensis TaxID=1262161 RepID=A0A075WWF4_PYRHA|nr:carbonic anhydrase 1 [Neoporphyra haitanensis]
MVSVGRVRQLLAATAVAAVALTGAIAPATAAAQGTQWTYYGKTGPKFWGSLDPDWSKCSTGRQQTPINIVPSRSRSARSLGSVAQQRTASFLPKGVQNGFKYDCVSTKGCGSATWARVKYDFVQFHLHIAAEHTLNGAVMPAELHLVHATKSGALLVVGVLIDVGEPSALIAKMLAGVEKAVTRANPRPFSRLPISKREWASLLPSRRGFCNYRGSLTTPPCSEGVTWIVSRQVVTASERQLARLARALLDSGAVVMTERPVQPLNGRQVVCYGV